MVGYSVAADVDSRWCSFLQTKKGAYRGNHIHPVDQLTVLLAGKAIIVKQINGKLEEHSLEIDKLHVTKSGIPHILIALEDSVAYEW
jgi:hypothetical protein